MSRLRKLKWGDGPFEEGTEKDYILSQLKPFWGHDPDTIQNLENRIDRLEEVMADFLVAQQYPIEYLVGIIDHLPSQANVKLLDGDI